MHTSKIVTTLFTAATLFATAATAHAEGVFMIDDFESYTGTPTGWSQTAGGVDVSLTLLETGAIEGNKDLKQTVAAAALGGNYTISKSTYTYNTLPGSITHFRFKHRILLGLNLDKSFRVTLTDQSNNTYQSNEIGVPLVELGNLVDYEIPLSSFSPSASGITSLKGVAIRTETGLLSIGAVEHIDSIRFAWDNSSVSDWHLY